MTGNSGLFEFKRKLKGAFARGGVYDHRGFWPPTSAASAGADVDVDCPRREKAATDAIEPGLGRAKERQLGQTAALRLRIEIFEAMIAMASVWRNRKEKRRLQICRLFFAVEEEFRAFDASPDAD